MENLENEKIQDQVEENNAVENTASIDADTGTAESGVSNETATEDTPQEGNVDSGVVEGNSEVEPENSVSEVQPTEKMLTQSQVNELVGKARAEGRESALKELYGRYGVNDDNEMNDMFGKGQGYDILNEEYQNLNGNFKNLSAENALLKSGVVANRWDDVKAILGMKGMDVSVENIQAELATHPEWTNAPAQPSTAKPELTPDMMQNMADNVKPEPDAPKVPSKIEKLGSNAPQQNNEVDENNLIDNLFGLKR